MWKDEAVFCIVKLRSKSAFTTDKYTSYNIMYGIKSLALNNYTDTHDQFCHL
jgi:hypothetical protein